MRNFGQHIYVRNFGRHIYVRNFGSLRLTRNVRRICSCHHQWLIHVLFHGWRRNMDQNFFSSRSLSTSKIFSKVHNRIRNRIMFFYIENLPSNKSREVLSVHHLQNSDPNLPRWWKYQPPSSLVGGDFRITSSWDHEKQEMCSWWKFIAQKVINFITKLTRDQHTQT